MFPVRLFNFFIHHIFFKFQIYNIAAQCVPQASEADQACGLAMPY